MKQSGIGNLAILPREVYDKIFEFIASSFEEPHDHLVEGASRLIRLEPLLSTSQRLRRELLEAYLRVNDVKTSGRKAWTLRSYIDSIVPLADLILHSRGIGVVQKLSLPGMQMNIARDCICYWWCYPDFRNWIPRRLKALRHCYEVKNIPAHRLFIEIDYASPVSPFPEKNSSERGHERTRFRSQATIYVADECTSTNELEKAIKHMRTILQDVHASFLGLPDDLLPQDSAHRTPIKRSADRVEETLARFREVHITVMRSILESWKDKDEFDEYCLDEFFKLVEAWDVS